MQNKQTMSPKLKKGLQKLTFNPENLGARLYHKGLNIKLEKMKEKPRLLKWKADGLIVHRCKSGVQIDWSELESSPTQTENRQPRKKQKINRKGGGDAHSGTTNKHRAKLLHQVF